MKLRIKDIPEEIIVSDEERRAEFETIRTELLENIEFVEMMYSDQADGIKTRIEKRKSEMYASLTLFIVVLMVDILLIAMLNSAGGGVLILATEMWLSLIYVFMALIKTGIGACKAIHIYLVHTERKICRGYIERHNVFTLLDEERFCVRKKLETREMYNELKKLDFDMPYDKYRDIEYIEKRADGNIYDGYTIKDIAWLALFVVAFWILFKR